MLAALGLLFSSIPMLAGSDSDTVHFRSPRDFSVVVPVYVNENGPYEFLFDTGSSVTAVDLELRRSLALGPIGPATITTVTGQSTASLAEARSIRVGSVSKSNVEVLVRDLGGLRNLDRKIRGVLGQDVLRDIDYLLDNRKRTIQFDLSGSLLESLSGERLQTLRIPKNSDYLETVVPATLAGGPSHALNLVLDSGSGSVVLFSDLARMLRAQRPSQAFLEDDGGRRQYVPESYIELKVGSTYRRTEAHLSALNLQSAGIDGLLPTSMFKAIYICNSRGFILLEPKQSQRRNSAHPVALASDRNVEVLGQKDE